MITAIIITTLIILLYIGKKTYINRLRKIRDKADITTIRGRATIKAINRKIDLMNGYRPKQYRIFERNPD